MQPPADIDALPLNERVRVQQVRLLSDNWYTLKTTRFDFLRRDGQWQTQDRETYDRGNGATVLLYQRAQRRVLLTRQFRYPVFVNGWPQLMTEAVAGQLDEADPLSCIRAEAEQEAGVRLRDVRPLFEAYMSPGSVTEKLHFFAAEYEAADLVSAGGGLVEEGEDITRVELDFDEAMRQAEAGEIVDAKTLLLLRWAERHVFGPKARPGPLLVFIAGPYRSGTGDSDALIAANVKAMQDAAVQVAQLGHVPVLVHCVGEMAPPPGRQGWQARREEAVGRDPQRRATRHASPDAPARRVKPQADPLRVARSRRGATPASPRASIGPPWGVTGVPFPRRSGLGEWVTLPLIEAAGGRRGDAIWDRYFHPNAQAVLERCDVLLRIGGESAGADAMVRAALARGLAVHYGLGGLAGLARQAP